MLSILIKCVNIFFFIFIFFGLIDIIIQVIQKIGFCISFYDVFWILEGFIGYGIGFVNVNGIVYYG